jgi:alcohol dehydrogenase (cytochrome c)
MGPNPACSLRGALLAGAAAIVAWPAFAAEVTPERLLNADKEPQNWLMNHRTYDGQRFSPLAQITSGIDQKTGKPVDYDPARDIQVYSGVANQIPGETVTKKACPSHVGGNNYWPSSYSRKTGLIYIAGQTGCDNMLIDTAKHNKEKGWNGGGYWTNDRYESNLTAVDPLTGEIRKNVHLHYPNYSGTLATAGGIVFIGLTDGTVAAFDDTTLDQLWSLNLGSAINTPPMTFAVNGKQYVAFVSGAGSQALKQLVNTPEIKEQRNSLMLFVFAL